MLPIKNCPNIKKFLTKTIGKGLDQADFFTGFGKLKNYSYLCNTRNKDNN